MCVNKLTILNKGYNPYDFLSTRFIKVPCGKCWQCRQQRSNDFSFRLLYEIKSKSLVPFFVTLTYNDDYLPILTFKDNNLKIRKLSVWNRQHLQNFHKVLRRQLQYYYGIDSSAFKYLSVCERGSSRSYVDSHGITRVATSRPHYHCIYMLFNSSDISPIRSLPSDFFSYCSAHSCNPDFVNFFRYLLHSRWFYGHVDDIAFCRDIVASVRYVCKYIMKDYGEHLFDVSPSQVIKLRDKRFDDMQASCISSKHYKRAPKPVYLSDLLPRPCSSINLGSSFLDNKTYDELFSLGVGNTQIPLPSVRNCSCINLPNYYYRKLCYGFKTLHLNRVYSERKNIPSGVVFGSLFTSPRYSYHQVWNNVFGCEPSVSKSPYVRQFLTFFGYKIRKFRFLKSFRLLKSYGSFLSFNGVFLRYLVDVFHSFPRSVQQAVQIPSSSFLDSLEKVRFTFSLYDFISFRRDSFNSPLSNLFNLLELCKFTQCHLSHLAFEKSYSKKLGSTAFDNPDLFMNHLI